MRIHFQKDDLYENKGRLDGHQFRAGEIYDFTPTFAQRFIRRDLAVQIEGGPAEVTEDVLEAVAFKAIPADPAEAPAAPETDERRSPPPTTKQAITNRDGAPKVTPKTVTARPAKAKGKGK